MTKRFDVIELPTDITPEFKEQVFKAFDSYWCLSDLQWETRLMFREEMWVLTSSTISPPDAASHSSLNAMRDGLRWGYKCGLNAPRPKPLTKVQRADKLYDDVHGSYSKYIKTAMEELKMTTEQAEYYFSKASSKRNKSRPI